jgi:hypothetical protein
MNSTAGLRNPFLRVEVVFREQSPATGLPTRNTAGSPTGRQGDFVPSVLDPQSSFIRSAAVEKLQINQLQILTISNLKFGPAIMSGA